ncbi:Hypothetical protein PHPALM_37581 [Phytophthora palmivora]|uniref:C2H2-type domain-containing protein n=1 Tax=Phytophthora palmivora TaxID=4796 RepID=A0A2P4WX20_9STRA|nr:Hypothetical protein PHPALM_37581 [Phytophthora palmivora]
MRRFCWRERSEKLNWRLLSALDVVEVVRRGDPAVLEPYALHVTFARLPTPKDPAIRDAWFLVRVLQLAMEYLLFMRTRDGDVLDSLTQELRQVEQERNELVVSVQKWKGRARTGEKQVEKLHQVLQNIAKLLQIHGASPSAVATIETLLTELIVERRAKQKRRVLEKDTEEMERSVQEARVCGFCGKMFSSAEYLEKHLVRRHTGENIELETPMKRKMKQSFVEEDKENNVKKEDMAGNEAAMEKMVQQVERALHEHEAKMQSLAEEEAQKVKQMYERLWSELKLAEERNAARVKIEQHQESQQQLDEVYLQKELAENELADLKQQIQFLTLKKKMVGTAVNAVSTADDSVLHKSDDALIAAKAEIKDLQETLEAVNAELTSSREELAKVQALHLSALRKKKELADKLTLSRGVSAVVLQENSSQTEQLVMINETAQTDEYTSPLVVESDVSSQICAPTCEDVGTDPISLSYQDVGIQTVLAPPIETSIGGVNKTEVQADTINERVPERLAPTNLVVPEPISQDSPNSTVVEKITDSATLEEEELSDYIQQIHIQDLLDTIVERAQSAASKVVSSPISRNCSSISRHKYVRSQFQHDENVVKDRVSSCLSQLEQFSRRFGVPAKSAWLSEANLNIVQQALHGHLEVLPTEVLAKMVVCENAVNTIIEKEWVPMEKARQQALERFKTEARVKSEFSQGLVQQAMAAFGASMKTNQGSGNKSEMIVEVNAEKPPRTEELPFQQQ